MIDGLDVGARRGQRTREENNVTATKPEIIKSTKDIEGILTAISVFLVSLNSANRDIWRPRY